MFQHVIQVVDALAVLVDALNAANMPTTPLLVVVRLAESFGAVFGGLVNSMDGPGFDVSQSSLLLALLRLHAEPSGIVPKLARQHLLLQVLG